MFDLQSAYHKLAANEVLSDAEIQSLLKEVEHFRRTAAYLASCHAGTAESLPASASKSAKRRHAAICKAAVDALRNGHVTWTLGVGDSEKQALVAAERCERWLAGAVMSNDVGVDREALISGGFLPTTYKGQEGEFLVKRMPIERMPEAGARLVDEDLIQSGMDAITEICPDGTVQLYIPDCDVLDDRQPVDSNAGRAMIADAIAAAADSMPHKRVSIIAPKESTERYRSGWERGDAFAVSGGELKADGPTDSDQETWEGFVDALSAHRAATAEALQNG